MPVFVCNENILFLSEVHENDREPCRVKFRELLERGAYKGAHPEKLAGKDPIFSIRLDQKKRALFVFYTHQSQQFAVVLTVMDNHKYGVSIPDLKDKQSEIERLFLERKEIKEAESIRVPVPVEAHFLHKRFITLGPEQSDILRLPNSVLMVGPGGTGKTTTFVAMLKETKKLDPKRKILCTSVFPKLTEQLRREEGMGQYPGKTYILSLKELYQNISGKKFLKPKESFGVFKKWRIVYQNVNSPLIKNFKKKFSSFSSELLFREFRIISGFKNKDDYSKIAKSQSSIDIDAASRNTLFSAYESFMVWLDGEKIYLMDFYDLSRERLYRKKYKEIFLDEAQALSLGQLQTVVGLLDKNGRIVILMDPKQSTQDAQSQINWIKDLLFSKGIDLDVRTMTTEYRCSKAVVGVALKVDELRKALVVKEKQESQMQGITGNGEEGRVCFYDLGTDFESFIRFKDDANVIVIAEDQYKSQLKTLGFSVILPPHQVTGLTFKTVLGYRLLENNKTINLALKQLSEGSSINLSADDSANVKLALSNLFMVVLRASDSFALVEEQGHANKELLDFLMPAFNQTTKNENNEAKKSSEEDWKKAALSYFEQNLTSIGMEILRERLKLTEDEIKAFLEKQGIAQTENPPLVLESTPEAKSKPSAPKLGAGRAKPKKEQRQEVPQKTQSQLIDEAYSAILRQDLNKIQSIVPQLQDVNSFNGRTYTLLGFAIKLKRKDIVKYLLTLEKVDVIEGCIKENGEISPPIYLAIVEDNLEMIIYFLESKRFTVAGFYDDCWTMLGAAIWEGSLTIVKHLVEKEFASLEIVSNANVSKDLTALAIAIERNKETKAELKLVQYLIEKGASIHCISKHGITALGYAIDAGDLEAVNYFVEIQKMDINNIGLENKTALQHAASIYAIEQLDIIEYLMTKIVDINACSQNGYSLLGLAVLYKNMPLAKFLVEKKGADINSPAHADGRDLFSFLEEDSPLKSYLNNKRKALLFSGDAVRGNTSKPSDPRRFLGNKMS